MPFDLYTFKFSTDPALTQAAQQDTFEGLNRLVSLAPMSSATSTFLKGMYGGEMPGGAGAYPTNRYVFPLWTNNKADLTMTSVNAGLDFNDPAEFSGDYACSNTHPMPHAEHVLRRCWSSGARAYLSQRYNLQAQGDCSQ